MHHMVVYVHVHACMGAHAASQSWLASCFYGVARLQRRCSGRGCWAGIDLSGGTLSECWGTAAAVANALLCVTCVRYDEPQLLKEVEKRLGASIPSLAEDLSLPPELQARLAGGPGLSLRLFIYVLLCVCRAASSVGGLADVPGSAPSWQPVHNDIV